MSNYSKLKRYQNLLKKGYIKDKFISHQIIFENFDKIINVSRIINLKNNFDIIFFRLLNYICSLKIRSKYTSIIHYWIPSFNSKNIIDPRSKYFLDKKSINNQINLVRTDSLISSIYLFFFLPNVIFFKGFQKINSFHEIKKLNSSKNRCFFYEKNEREFSKNLKKFLLKKKIKKLICIDDYRVVQTLLNAAEKLKIKTLAYQHGRFNQFQVCFNGRTFDEYIVWSKFFKKSIIKINKNYKKKKIKILNFRFEKFQQKEDKDNVLYLCEQKVPINQIKSDISILCKVMPNEKIFIRLRDKASYPKNFLDFLNLQKVRILKENTLFKAVSNNGIKYLIAYYSTALLEVSLYNVYPIMLIKNNFHLNDYSKKNLVFKLKKIENFLIFKNKLNSKKNKSRLTKIKKKIWS